MVNPSRPGYYDSHPNKFRELILILLSKHEDLRIANQAKEKLLKENEGFLISTITKWIGGRKDIDFHDLLEEANLAFLSAIAGYEKKHGVSLRTYARYHLLDLRRRYFKRSPDVELKDEHLTEVTYLSDPQFREFNLTEELELAMMSLSPTEKEVIKLHYFTGMKKRAIAEQRGCSETRISQIVLRALPKMKAALEKKGITPAVLDFN